MDELYLTLEQQEAIASWLKQTVAYPPDMDKHFIGKFGKHLKKKEMILESIQRKIVEIDDCILFANELKDTIAEDERKLIMLQKKINKISKYLKKV